MLKKYSERLEDLWKSFFFVSFSLNPYSYFLDFLVYDCYLLIFMYLKTMDLYINCMMDYVMLD